MIILILKGVYGYGALTTSSGNRATTLARFDGLELVARVSGTLLSPVLSNKIDRYANFSLKLICDLLAVLYLIFIINVHIIGNLHFKNFINLINALNKKLNSPLSLVIFVMIAIFLITS